MAGDGRLHRAQRWRGLRVDLDMGTGDHLELGQRPREGASVVGTNEGECRACRCRELEAVAPRELGAEQARVDPADLVALLVVERHLDVEEVAVQERRHAHARNLE